jgi:peroxiredoxin
MKSFLASGFLIITLAIVPIFASAQESVNHDKYWADTDFSIEEKGAISKYVKQLKKYFEKELPQNPDVINSAVDYILRKSQPNNKMFKETYTYLDSKYGFNFEPCMDKVTVNLALNWFTAELAFWAKAEQIKKKYEAAKRMEPVCCGMEAPNMRLKDTTGAWHELHKDESEYIVLFFWEPDCDHCVESAPKLSDIYDKYKDKGVSIWAICTGYDTPEWRAFIKENNMNFLNVADNATDEFLNNLREAYDIYFTPEIFILDKDKKIITKRIKAHELDAWLQNKIGEM